MSVKRHLDALLSSSIRPEIEACLATYLPARRWFRSKARVLVDAAITHAIGLPIDGLEVSLVDVHVRFTEGLPEDYALLLAWVEREIGEELARARPHLIIRPPDQQGPAPAGTQWLVDALGEPRALRGLLALIARGATIAADGCLLTCRLLGGALGASASPRLVETEQSNTSIVFGDAILKVIRKLEEGPSPDLELGEYLTRAGYTHAPALLASVELSCGSAAASSLAMVHAFVPNDGDAWTFALATIARSCQASSGTVASLPSDAGFVRPLAVRIAEMHRILEAPTDDPRFAPEPIERAEREALGRAVGESLAEAWSLVDADPGRLPDEARERARLLRGREAACRRCIARYIEAADGGMKTRVHGDLHLGQMLVAGDDFFVIDFEGEPARPLAERKAKRSPLVDVSGMLRSLHYASVAAWRAAAAERTSARERAEAWLRDAQREFVAAYFETAAGHRALAVDPRARAAALRFHLLEKCVYELHYEMNSRPDWVTIPLFGLEQIIEDDDALSI